MEKIRNDEIEEDDEDELDDHDYHDNIFVQICENIMILNSVPSVSHGNAASATKKPHHDQIDRIVNKSYSYARTTYSYNQCIRDPVRGKSK